MKGQYNKCHKAWLPKKNYCSESGYVDEITDMFLWQVKMFIVGHVPLMAITDLAPYQFCQHIASHLGTRCPQFPSMVHDVQLSFIGLTVW